MEAKEQDRIPVYKLMLQEINRVDKEKKAGQQCGTDDAAAVEKSYLTALMKLGESWKQNITLYESLATLDSPSKEAAGQLLETERNQYALLHRYLPKQATEQEITDAISQARQALGFTRDTLNGKELGMLLKYLHEKCDPLSMPMKRVAELAKQSQSKP